MNRASANFRFRRFAQPVAKISKFSFFAFGCFDWEECLNIQDSLSFPACSSVLKIRFSDVWVIAFFVFALVSVDEVTQMTLVDFVLLVEVLRYLCSCLDDSAFDVIWEVKGLSSSRFVRSWRLPRNLQW